MDYTIRENSFGKYLTVFSHEFKPAIQFAFENKLEAIRICGVLGEENLNSIADFKEIEKLASYLKTLQFDGVVNNKILNFESVYTLNKIENILINTKQKFSIDVAMFKNLKHLGAEYWKGLINIDKIETIESMVIRKYPKENINELLKLKKLKILHIYSSKIKSLEGIEKISNLEEITLAYNRNLENIDDIKKLKLLKKLCIDKCNNIKEYEFIHKLENMKNVYHRK